MRPHEQERLSAYLDDALSPDERSAVEAHLARCEECRERLAGLAAVDPAARQLEVRAPEGYFDTLAARVRGRIEADAARRGRVSWRPPAWSWAVAAALLLAVLTPLTLHERGAVPSAPAPAQAPAPPAAPSAAPVDQAQARQPPPADRPVEPGPPRSVRTAPAPPRERRQEAPPAVGPRGLTLERAAVGGGVTGNEAVPVSVPPAPVAAQPAESRAAESKAAGSAPVSMEAADTAAPKGATPAAAPAPFRRQAAMEHVAVDAGEAFRRLERIHPTDLSGWRAQRGRWRAFAESYPAAAQADEARVRAIAAGLELVRLGAGGEDEAEFRQDAERYLSREDAAQKPRVRALLEAAGPSR